MHSYYKGQQRIKCRRGQIAKRKPGTRTSEQQARRGAAWRRRAKKATSSEALLESERKWSKGVVECSLEYTTWKVQVR
jgi:hypothetical protein